jgi:hypothetical protein
MKKMLMVTVFMLAALAWAAQQPGVTQPGSGQATSPGSQVPSANPGSVDQNAAPAGAQGGGQEQPSNAPIKEGCLGGSSPNFTITDSAGTTYKLNLPPGADGSVLTSHIGESVQVMGGVKQAGGTGSIDASRIGRGTGKCPASNSNGQAPPKQ